MNIHSNLPVNADAAIAYLVSKGASLASPPPPVVGLHGLLQRPATITRKWRWFR